MQEQQLEKHIKECLNLKIMLESNKDALKDCIEAVAEKYRDLDAADIRAIVEKAYAKTYKTEAYEKAKGRIERTYEVVESLK